jgi:hypothetical protein
MRNYVQLSQAWWQVNCCRSLRMTRKGKVRTGLGLLILGFSILFLVWGYWPAHRELRARPVSMSAGGTSVDERALTLLFPPRVRVGEAAVVRLTLAVDTLNDALNSMSGGGFPEVYNTHDIIVEARFDIPGIPVQPSELISAPVSKGQTAVFYWTLRPGEPGKFRGTIWLYLRLVDKLTGQERRETVSAQIVEIESIKFLGFVVNQARMIGLVGAVVGVFLSLPLFEALAVKRLRKRSEIL